MKKTIIFIALVFITFMVIGQEKQMIKIGFDPKLAIDGAYSYDETPVLDISLTLLTQLESGWEGGITVEYAKLNPTYYHYGFVLNKKINIFNSEKRIETLLGTEALILFRDFVATKKQLWLTAGANAEFRYYIIDNIGLSLRANYKYRPDISKFRFNGIFELIVIF